jgi:hypothetical protein
MKKQQASLSDSFIYSSKSIADKELQEIFAC